MWNSGHKFFYLVAGWLPAITPVASWLQANTRGTGCGAWPKVHYLVANWLPAITPVASWLQAIIPVASCVPAITEGAACGHKFYYLVASWLPSLTAVASWLQAITGGAGCLARAQVLLLSSQLAASHYFSN